jgi:ferredoxin
MTEKMKKVSDIIEEAEAIRCPVKRVLRVTDEFLKGPMCGRCFPCSFGSYEARLRLREITEGNGAPGDVDVLRDIARKMLVMSMCKKGKDVGRAMLEALESPAFGEHLEGLCAEKECTAFIEYRNVPENCIRCGLCQDACRFDAIHGEKQISYKSCFLPFEIRQRRCVKCGECIKVCPTNAIVIVDVGTEAEVKA